MEKSNANYVITIARRLGSGGRAIGKLLAKELSINYYDKDLIRLASEESGINLSLFGKADENIKLGLFKKYNKEFGTSTVSPSSDEFISDNNLFNYQAKIIRKLAEKESCVIVGRCADFVLKDSASNLIRTYIYAEQETRITNIMDTFGYTRDEAIKSIEKTDKTKKDYYKYYTGKIWDNPDNYDICINMSKLSFEEGAQLVKDYLKLKGIIE